MDGSELVNAQNQLMSNDPHAILVKTDDLSCHYHFDLLPSQLIIGYRVALAFKSLLGIQEPQDYCSLSPNMVER
jgi:hypothetical protein